MIDQLLMTLTKLWLNQGLLFCFGLLVSCLKVHDNMDLLSISPFKRSGLDANDSIEQVFGTLPLVFWEKFSSTYAIIDSSKILFLETPNDLQVINMEQLSIMQQSF